MLPSVTRAVLGSDGAEALQVYVFRASCAMQTWCPLGVLHPTHDGTSSSFLVWEEELEQNPDTAPGVHEGASPTKGIGRRFFFRN